MPRTHWLLAAAAVLPLLVPSSAVSYPPAALDGHGDQLREGLWGERVQGGLRSGGGDGARGRPPPPGTDAPVRGLPWYKSTLTIRAEDGGKVARLRRRGALRRADALGDGSVWVTLPSESKEAYAKLTAGLTPRPARTLPGVGEDALPVARVDEVVEPPSAATPAPASDGSNVWIVALGGGVLAALMAGLLLRIRHRRASTPPAAPEAPGAA